MLIIAGFVSICLGFFVREVLRAPIIDDDSAPLGPGAKDGETSAEAASPGPDNQGRHDSPRSP